MKKLLMVLLTLFTQSLLSQPARLKDSDTLKSSTLSGLKFRSIGPAVIGGSFAGVEEGIASAEFPKSLEVSPCFFSEIYPHHARI